MSTVSKDKTFICLSLVFPSATQKSYVDDKQCPFLIIFWISVSDSAAACPEVCAFFLRSHPCSTALASFSSLAPAQLKLQTEYNRLLPASFWRSLES